MMNKLVAWAVAIIGLIYSLGALNLYEVPYGDAIVGLIILLIGIAGIAKKV